MDPYLLDHGRQRKRKMSIVTLSMNEEGGLSPIEKRKKEEKREGTTEGSKEKKKKQERNLKE